MLKKIIMFLTGTILLTTALSGCFQGEQSIEEIDAPENSEAVDGKNKAEDEEAVGDDSADKEGQDDKEEAVEESSESKTIARDLYLVDSEGMVASQTLEIPNAEGKEVATQALEYLVKDGPISSILPNGFQAILPAGTEVLGMNLKEDEQTLIVDVSEEFKEYEAEDELKILQSMTYTLTQFDNVDRIKLRIDGEPQSEMPVDATPIEEGYSRANGINLSKSDTVDLINSDVVTMYYPTEHEENRYYVPVTEHVQASDNVYTTTVQALMNGPGFNTSIMHVFNQEAKLVNDPELKDGTLELVFNEGVLKESDENIISDEVMETLVRTLTERDQVEAVDVKVENVEEIVNENGESYSEPVTKNHFKTVEKL